jgi:hypothetical protein
MNLLIEEISGLRKEKTIFYVGIGSYNYLPLFPLPNNRQEFPEYIEQLQGYNKVLILIDPIADRDETEIRQPLFGSDHILEIIKKEDKYDHYVTSDNINIFVLRMYLYLDYSLYRDSDIVTEHRNLLVELVSICLNSDVNSLFIISCYTGENLYHLQDEILNMFNPESQEDFRERFLIDSSYYYYTGCYCDLTDINNQPIIENGKIFNPGHLSNREFNELLSNSISDRKKLNFMRSLFLIKLDKNLNQDYRNLRLQYISSIDPDEKIIIQEIMINIIREFLKSVESFINIEEFINNLREINIYEYEKQIKNMFDQILNI